jgi:two-component system LytT family response regulator
MDALEALQTMPVDLVFSDIQMQGFSGIQLINSLQVKPMVVLVTAYQDYALQGYEMDIVDYLLKPVPYERFVKAANKALALHNMKYKDNPPADHIFLNIDYSLVKVVLRDMLYLEGVKDYVRVHYVQDKKLLPLLVRISMKAMEDMLPAGQFYRIHKSYIVNAAGITAIRKNSIFLSNLELPVSDQYKDVIGRLTSKTL